MPTTWARQWMNASEEILILQTQPNESVYSGHKYSDHFPPSILLCVSIRHTIISGLSSPLYPAQEPRGLHRLSESFSSNDSESQTPQQQSAALEQYKTCWKLFSALVAPEFLKYPISTESLRLWHFICITQGRHDFYQWWGAGTPTAGLIPQLF